MSSQTTARLVVAILLALATSALLVLPRRRQRSDSSDSSDSDDDDSCGLMEHFAPQQRLPGQPRRDPVSDPMAIVGLSSTTATSPF